MYKAQKATFSYKMMQSQNSNHCHGVAKTHEKKVVVLDRNREIPEVL